jgi:transposase
MRPLLMLRDARSLDHATLEEFRRQAIRRIQAGDSLVEIAADLQVHPNTVSKWKARFRRGGLRMLASTKGTGRPPTLDGRQMFRLRRIIVGKNPRHLNFGVALWTLPVVGDLVTALFDVGLHQTTISRILHKLGLTPQKPIRRAFRRDEQEIWMWTQVEFPKIVRRAKRAQATLLFLDETGVHEDHAAGTTWGARGQTPRVIVHGGRKRINVISTISPRGRLWFRCYPGTLGALLFVEFLEALIADVKDRIILVMDRHPAHVAAATKRWLHEHRHRIEVHFLPGYAPELNPDEHVWARLKGMFRQDVLGPDERLDNAVELAMNEIRKDPALVKSFFQHPDVKYVQDALGW